MPVAGLETEDESQGASGRRCWRLILDLSGFRPGLNPPGGWIWGRGWISVTRRKYRKIHPIHQNHLKRRKFTHTSSPRGAPVAGGVCFYYLSVTIIGWIGWIKWIWSRVPRLADNPPNDPNPPRRADSGVGAFMRRPSSSFAPFSPRKRRGTGPAARTRASAAGLSPGNR
jgi:hypothetical protein